MNLPIWNQSTLSGVIGRLGADRPSVKDYQPLGRLVSFLRGGPTPNPLKSHSLRR